MVKVKKWITVKSKSTNFFFSKKKEKEKVDSKKFSKSFVEKWKVKSKKSKVKKNKK